MKKKVKFKNIITILAIVYFSYVLVNQTFMMKRISNEITSAKAQFQKVKDDNDKLSDEYKLSKTDSYAEKVGRERLGLIKEGETPVADAKK